MKKDIIHVMPGINTRLAFRDVNDRESKIYSKDTQNRDYVVRTITSYVKNGLELEQALDKIMKDDIVKEFEYLRKNGIDIRTCFKNWAQREIAKPRRTNERTR